MLAYVFWHAPDPAADRAAYEHALAEFHASLEQSPPPGFYRSAAFRVDGLDWVGDYEDWYLIEDWSALGRINEAAVSSPHRPAHDAAAAHTAKGAGGVYQLLAGDPDFTSIRSAAWLHKPRGTTYPDFIASLRPHADTPGAALWQRQLVLGPAREFCLWTAEMPEVEGALSRAPAALWPRD
jgi:hypothetical protein